MNRIALKRADLRMLSYTLALFSATLGCFGGSVAWAHNSGGAGGLRVSDGAPDQVNIDVRGRVAQRCQFMAGAAPATTAQVAMAGGAATVVPFRVYCNTGFTVNVSSQNGGLLTDGARLPQSSLAAGFHDIARYTARFDLGRDDGSSLSETCTSQQLHDGAHCTMAEPAGLTSSVPAMNQSGKLTIRMAEVDPVHMVAGTYSDTVTINVQAKL